MLGPTYAALVIARILQGISSTVIWTVGSALLCDTVPEDRIGQQFGIALTGLSSGSAIAPTVGGALYNSFGFRAPFIFSLGLLGFDLILRCLIIEKTDAMKWGFDPTATCPKAGTDQKHDEQAPSRTTDTPTHLEKVSPIKDAAVLHAYDQKCSADENNDKESTLPSVSSIKGSSRQSSLRLILTILHSKRAMSAVLSISIYAYVVCFQSKYQFI